MSDSPNPIDHANGVGRSSDSNGADKPTVANVPRIASTDLRVQLATERTLLAWVRTGLALIAFGFVVARTAIVLQTMGVTTDISFTVVATLIGILMIVLGVMANACASLHYRKYFQTMKAGGEEPFTAWKLVVWIAIATATIGAFLIVYLLLFDFAILSAQ